MKNIRENVVDLLLIAFGSAVFSLGVHCFISSNDIALGGATGIAIILSRFFPIGLGTLILIVNIPLLILGFILLNRAVMLKTLFSVALVTVFTDLAELYIPVYDAGGSNGLIADSLVELVLHIVVTNILFRKSSIDRVSLRVMSPISTSFLRIPRDSNPLS